MNVDCGREGIAELVMILQAVLWMRKRLEAWVIYWHFLFLHLARLSMRPYNQSLQPRGLISCFNQNSRQVFPSALRISRSSVL